MFVWHHVLLDAPGPPPATRSRSPPFCAKIPGQVFPSRVLKSRACHGRAGRGCQIIATSLFSWADSFSAAQSPSPGSAVVLRVARFRICPVLSPSSSKGCEKPRFPNSEPGVYTCFGCWLVTITNKQNSRGPQPTPPAQPPIPGHTPELQLDPPPLWDTEPR